VTLLDIYDLDAKFVVKKILENFMRNLLKIYLLYHLFLQIFISKTFHIKFLYLMQIFFQI